MHEQPGPLLEAPAAQDAGERSAARPLYPQDDWDVEHGKNIVPLTRAEAEKLFGPKVGRRSPVTPLRVVAAQVGVSLIVALIVWLFFGRSGQAALSALLGGAVCWVPGGLFALYLKRAGSRSKGALIVGEALKTAITLALFIAIGMMYHKVHWLPMLVAYLVALKTYWAALAF